MPGRARSKSSFRRPALCWTEPCKVATWKNSKLLAKYFSGLCHKHFPQSNQLCAESEQLKVAIYVMIWKNRSPSFLQQNKSPSFMMLDYHKDDNDCIIETGKHHALVILDSRLSQLPPVSLNQAPSALPQFIPTCNDKNCLISQQGNILPW